MSIMLAMYDEKQILLDGKCFFVRQFRQLRRFFVKTFYIFTFLNETVCTVFGILYARVHQNNGKAVDLIVVCNLNIVGQHRLLSLISSDLIIRHTMA